VSEPSDSTKEALGRSEGSKVQHSRSRSIPCSIRNTYYKEATRQSVGLGIYLLDPVIITDSEMRGGVEIR
jgi:hypothetical protein